MAMMDLDGSSLLADSHAKLVGLVQGLIAMWQSVCIHQMNQMNSCQWPQHDDGTMNIVIGVRL